MAVNNEIPSMGSSEAAQAVVQNLGDIPLVSEELALSFY